MSLFDRKESAKDVAGCTDFSLLSPIAKISDVKKHCNIAFKHQYFSVCVNPVNVQIAKTYITKELKKDIKVCAVVGFPLGENTTNTKLFEAKNAIAEGADEIDFVISVSRCKSGDFAYVKNEITRMVRLAKKRVVKVIIETGYLNREEINKVVKICMRAKVDFIQTSTGYSMTQTTPEDVDYIARLCKGKCSVKAAGGVLTKQDAINLIRAGCTRIGTSRIL